jgi:hypothetical protein
MAARGPGSRHWFLLGRLDRPAAFETFEMPVPRRRFRGRNSQLRESGATSARGAALPVIER